jgi:CubicO group peptidase (beta-lactamase class C family)
MIRLGWLILAVLVAASLPAGDRVPGAHWDRVKSPADAGWSVEKLQEARAFSETLDTAAVMIVEDGLVIDEWGATALPLNCHSVRKSLLSALYGPHVAAGTIRLDRTLEELGVDDNEPSLSRVEKGARLVDLLKARSGVYHPALYETAAMAAARPARGSHEPDTFWYYNNWDFNAAGAIFENLTGTSLFEEFERRLAAPLQMEDFVRGRHTEYVTGGDSVYPAYPFQLSTRDLARFGLLFLRNGRWGTTPLVPEEWVRESTASYSDAKDSGGYGYMWWVAVEGRHFPGVTLPDGCYSARGNRGQYLVVVPEWDLVVCHRVNSFQKDTSVSKAEFGQLLALILAARPATPAKVASNAAEARAAARFDVLIRGGEVIDGTGRDRFRADVGLIDGTIAAIGPLGDATAERTIDAAGRIVVPGFIDLHSHADEGLVSDDPLRRSAPNLITQGITTVVINQDGSGPLSLADQRRAMERRGVGLNVAQMLGHGTIRREALGEDFRRPASPEEIERMRELIGDAMQGGAFGLSAGLEYVPGRWSTPAEMEQLVAELKPYGGVYVVHERSSGSRPMWFLPSRDPARQPSMIDNLQELIDIAAATQVTVVATHIKARGTDFWGSSGQMISMIEGARAAGLPLFADQYAYNTSGSDGRIVLLPDWSLAAGAEESPAAGGQPARRLTPAERLESVLKDAARASALRRDVEYEITRRGGAGGILIVEHSDRACVGLVIPLRRLSGCNSLETAIKPGGRGCGRSRCRKRTLRPSRPRRGLPPRAMLGSPCRAMARSIPGSTEHSRASCGSTLSTGSR